jgi:hypothetical protein
VRRRAEAQLVSLVEVVAAKVLATPDRRRARHSSSQQSKRK